MHFARFNSALIQCSTTFMGFISFVLGILQCGRFLRNLQNMDLSGLVLIGNFQYFTIYGRHTLSKKNEPDFLDIILFDQFSFCFNAA